MTGSWFLCIWRKWGFCQHSSAYMRGWTACQAFLTHPTFFHPPSLHFRHDWHSGQKRVRRIIQKRLICVLEVVEDFGTVSHGGRLEGWYCLRWTGLSLHLTPKNCSNDLLPHKTGQHQAVEWQGGWQVVSDNWQLLKNKQSSEMPHQLSAISKYETISHWLTDTDWQGKVLGDAIASKRVERSAHLIICQIETSARPHTALWVTAVQLSRLQRKDAILGNVATWTFQRNSVLKFLSSVVKYFRPQLFYSISNDS